MLPTVFVLIFLILPQYVQSSCCRLPFTDGECQVNRKGPHRYQVMPDRVSGQVMESTECYINDFDANYRKVVETKNYCNECPGLLILHANSSDIFLYPEYLERILEGRTPTQRKNVVILTTSLVGAYDLDFTLFSRYYASHSIAEVPSLYVDLQLPAYDPKKETQPNLRLRLPSYNEDREGESKISREDLLNPVENNKDIAANIHKLPYLYHFDIEKHRHAPSLCTLYNVHVTSSSLVWELLDSALQTCHEYMPYFGRNKCFATGFTRLFCSIEESITKDEHLQLFPFLKTTNRVEHLTLAVTGNRHVEMSLSNDQTRPAEQVKILLVQGHLVVTDINLNLPMRVEYGWNCNEFSLAVPAGFSATRYRRFDGENLAVYEGNNVITLPSCFRVIPVLSPMPSSNASSTFNPPLIELDSDEDQSEYIDQPKPEILIDLNMTDPITEEEHNVSSNFWDIFRNKNNLAYAIIVLLVLVALIPLCLGVFYRVYCRQNRKSNWTLEHGSHTNSAYENSKGDLTEIPNPPYVSHSTQTTDTPIRI